MNQIEDMQTFVRIVEAGSITKAADQLNTVKSAVSRRLSDLERRLAVTLLTRTTRTQTLTDNGKSYYQHCLRIIDDISEIESGLRHDNCALSGLIKIAAPLSFGLDHLGAALRKFNELHPGICFDVDFNDRKIDLIEEGFDLAIRISNLEDSSLIARKLTTNRFVLAASPGYLKARGNPKKPQDLTTGHVKLYYRGAPENWQFRGKQGQLISIKLPTAITANNGNFLLQSAIDGIGLIYTPDFICYKAMRLGQLTSLLNEYLTDIEVPVYAIYPQNRHLSHRVRSLVDYLAQYFGEQPYWRL
ncbi:LysR family transcriptional regulator ['Osedax' symbiont bacterium Rs2_46_30_T18]|nr:LysR family transcriptional regulator ['Osedax' symbiont bacterium Rs2_46_30_T18]